MPQSLHNLKKYLCCPVCFGELQIRPRSLTCVGCKHKYKYIDTDIPSLILPQTDENQLSMTKWDKLYSDKNYRDEVEDDYHRASLESTKKQLLKAVGKKAKGVFLELGSGTGMLGEEMARGGWFFIGVDFSPASLVFLKRRLEKHGIKNYLLVHGDIRSLPIKTNTINFIYGGGVIEHFQNTQVVIDHLHRVLKPGGVTFNSVPLLNLGNLIYRSQWGGIPNLPVVKQLAELVHIKLLKARHMVFGYELQFTRGQLRKLHQKSGFAQAKIDIDKFETIIQLHRISHPLLRKMLINLCENNSLFWPSIKVMARK